MGLRQRLLGAPLGRIHGVTDRRPQPCLIWPVVIDAIGKGSEEGHKFIGKVAVTGGRNMFRAITSIRKDGLTGLSLVRFQLFAMRTIPFRTHR